jgi:rRNA-processing protein FCF1
MSSSNTKVTVNLPDVVVRELKELARANNVTMTDVHLRYSPDSDRI